MSGVGQGTGGVVHTRAFLEATDAAVHVHRPDVIALCERHGFDANWVASIGYEVVDMPLLRFGVHLNDGEGHRYLEGCTHTGWDDQGHDECRIAMREFDVALRGDLPEWWRPGVELSKAAP